MTTLADLKSAVSSLLGARGAAKTLTLNSNTRERAFEAYVFALVLRAVRQAGGTVMLVGIRSGPNPSTLVFRGSPGQMSSGAQDFVYAQCNLNGSEFEVHVDVQYEGSSGAMHEIDVSIYEHKKAEAVRDTRALPTARKLFGAIECKFYDSTLGTSLGRAFVGLTSDCGSLRIAKAFVTNGRSLGLARYLGHSSRPEYFPELSPLRSGVANRFVATLEQKLRMWAKIA